MLDLSAASAVARARAAARISKHQETHLGHIFIELLGRAEVHHIMLRFSSRRSIGHITEILLRTLPKFDQVQELAPPLSPASLDSLRVAETRCAAYQEARAVQADDLFVAVLLMDDPIVRRTLQQHEIDQQALIESFAPGLAKLQR